jgi:shikimate dehydrogenase
MQQYGIIGYPLGHSFSKKYFTQKFLDENIDAEFLNFEIESVHQIKNILIETPKLKGFCVTIPHKENIIPLLDEIDPLAKKLGAVNSVKVIRTDNKIKLKGYNTDIYGFQKSLLHFLQNQTPKALILGTGGASKAVAGALQEINIPYLFVSRNKKKNQITYQDLNSKILSEYHLIINTTPLGTFPNVNTYPDLPYDMIGSEHFLYDLVYNPNNTMFMQKGTKQGAKTHNGLKMLHLQAEKSWNIWNQ